MYLEFIHLASTSSIPVRNSAGRWRGGKHLVSFVELIDCI